MEPVYRNLEFCRDPETLWGKMREARWDWIGVHPKSGFVLGSPRASRLTDHAAATLTKLGASQGEHGTRVRDEPNHPTSESWFATESEAQEDYARLVREYTDREGPLMVLVERIEGGEPVEHRVILDKTSTYTWRPPPSTGD